MQASKLTYSVRIVIKVKRKLQDHISINNKLTKLVLVCAGDNKTGGRRKSVTEAEKLS